MKIKRQAVILEIIKDNIVETQDELMRMLQIRGYEVTQATISRDINDLKLVKSPIGDGKYKYIVGSEVNKDDMSEKFFTLFSASVMSVVHSNNIVVIKTLSGMAQAICSYMDKMDFKGILGTIAGDDTIFIATSGENSSLSLIRELNLLFNK